MRRLILVIVAWALVLAAPALAERRFRDSTGENAAAADITSVIVLDDAATGNVEFTVFVANSVNLANDGFGDEVAFDLFIDADRNRATGNPRGFDAEISLGGQQDGVSHWDGREMSPTVGTTGWGFATHSFSVSVARTDILLKRPKQSFDFVAVSHRETANHVDVVDAAPDHGVYTYTLAVLPPPAHVVSSAVAVTIAAAAGQLFQVGQFSVSLSDGTTVPMRDQSCTASVAGTRIRGTGAGHCTWLLPTTSRGKRLVVIVSGHHAGHRYRKRLTYRIA